MSNYIQLLINEPSTAELDLNQEIDIALQYSIADIKDISKRNAAYSKTIIVPGTKNNNYWFGNLFDINSDFSGFNPNKKIAAKLLVNTEIVIDGFLQLKKIVKLNNTDPQGNSINYEIVIFNNTVDLMSAIGEKTINQLDLSEFGHTFSAANIKASWNHTYKDGYVYPMFGLQSSDNEYKPENFYPSIFYRTILDQMVRGAGFGWTGSLLTNDQFNNEVISYVTDGRPKIDDDVRRSRQFYVGLTPSTKDQYIGNVPNTFTGALPLQIGPSFSGYIIPFNNESSPFYDNGSNWDSTLYEWNINNNGNFSAKYQLNYDANIRNTSSTTTVQLNTAVSTSLNIRLTHYLEYSKDGGSSWVTWDTSVQNLSYTQATIAPGASASKSVDVRREAPALTFELGDKVRLRVRGWQTNYAIYAGVGGATPGLHMRLVFKENIGTGGSNYLKNTAIVGEFTQNDFIELARYLPDKVKQKDLLTDLIRRYNLYIQTDPDNPKVLIFDSRPDFYERGSVVDWTMKKDMSSTDEITLLSELQSKLMIWSYKADTDNINKTYTDITGDIYGQYKYYFDNDFVKGENKIESQFSPTPLVKTPFNAIVSAIDPEQPKVQPRIFYWGGLRNCDSWFWTYQDPITGATGSTESFTQYPYAGHFDDPIEPEIDINFGNNKFYFYNDWSYITDNNMFNTYWSDYVRQIESGRLLTSYFYLDEYDIRFIKDNFYTKVFIVDSYYYVNKIIDYKPLSNGVTKVELIKIIDGLRWEPKQTNSVTTTKPDGWTKPNFEAISLGKGNVFDSGLIYGDNNISSGVVRTEYSGWSKTTLNKNMIIGNNNRLSSDAGLILGNDNIVTADFGGIVLGGSGNRIESDGVVLIGTSNVTATQSGKIYLGDNYIVDIETGTVQVGSYSVNPLVYYTEDTTLKTATLNVVDVGVSDLTHQLDAPNGTINSFATDGSKTGQIAILPGEVDILAFDGSTSNTTVLTQTNFGIAVVDGSVSGDTNISSDISSIQNSNATDTNLFKHDLTGETPHTEITVSHTSGSQSQLWVAKEQIYMQSSNDDNISRVVTEAEYASIEVFEPIGLNSASILLNLTDITTTVTDGTDSNQVFMTPTETKITADNGTYSWFSVAAGAIKMTVDDDTYTHINFTVNGTYSRLNIVGLPATASEVGDVWVDTNGFLRIVK